ncbi:41057_t:CDS:2, partial [Gigaspora margarita]
LTSDFEECDVLPAIEHFKYSYTSEQIKEYLESKIKEFGLNRKIICAITDNKTNIKKAIKDLNTKNPVQEHNFEYIPENLSDAKDNEIEKPIIILRTIKDTKTC